MYENYANQETPRMVIDERMKADLLSSAKWAKFLCIVGSICLGFMIIGGLSMIALAGKMSSMSIMGGAGAVVGVTYIICAAIMIYPLIKGFQFANGVKAACLTGSEAELASGFSGMHSWLKFYGILTIIVLTLYVLILLVVAIGAAVAASQF